MKRMAICTAALVFLSVQALADSRVVERAEDNVRRLITQSGPWTRVSFSKSTEGYLSINEARVSGDGVAYQRDRRGDARFRYSVKVHRRTYETRDAEVVFDDGRRITAGPEWNEPTRPGSGDVRILEPRSNETLRSTTVTFRGDAADRRSVRVTVYDRNGRERGRKQVSPDRNLRWSTSMRLDEGTHRVVATVGGRSSEDEVRFHVRRASADWDDGRWTESRVSRITVLQPRSGETLMGAMIRATGTATTRDVVVSIYDGSRRVFVTKERTYAGRWTIGARLSRGSYRLVAETDDARSREDVRFFVR